VIGLSPTPSTTLDGTNLLPYLLGEENDPPHQTLYWSYEGQLAIRQTCWKMVVYPFTGGQPELYNLNDDVSEQRNLAGEHPEILGDMMSDIRSWQASLAAASGGGDRAREPRISPKNKH
jgi:arylsulfatase A-like enzyme